MFPRCKSNDWLMTSGAPLSGRVIETNGDLENQPELVNNDPYGTGWLVVLEVGDPGLEKSNLLSAADYQALVSD